MGFTSTSLRKSLTEGTPFTSGVLGYYGFDINVYMILMLSIPSQLDFDKLIKRLKIVITQQTDEQLHQAYLDKTYRVLLGEGFEWVRTTKYFPIF
jgi:hypothetical protein